MSLLSLFSVLFSFLFLFFLFVFVFFPSLRWSRVKGRSGPGASHLKVRGPAADAGPALPCKRVTA